MRLMNARIYRNEVLFWASLGVNMNFILTFGVV